MPPVQITTGQRPEVPLACTSSEYRAELRVLPNVWTVQSRSIKYACTNVRRGVTFSGGSVPVSLFCSL